MLLEQSMVQRSSGHSCDLYASFELDSPKLLWALKLTLYNTIAQKCYFAFVLLFSFVSCHTYHPIVSIPLPFLPLLLSISTLPFFPHCHPLVTGTAYSISHHNWNDADQNWPVHLLSKVLWQDYFTWLVPMLMTVMLQWGRKVSNGLNQNLRSSFLSKK